MIQKETCAMTDTIKLVGGGLVGAGLALLLAPKSGKQTRSDIVRYARTFGGKTPEAVYDFSCSISEFIDSVGSKAAEILTSGGEMSNEAKRGLLAAIEKGQEQLEKQKRKLSDMIGQA